MFNNLNLNGCLFYIGGRHRPIEYVTSYSHLRHIINCHSDDKDDVMQRRCNFTGQAINVYCFFKTQDMVWSLEDDVLQDFCCSWRTGLRRLLNLPNNTHCFLLHIFTGTLPVFDEICKRSSSFVYSCLRSRYKLVRFIALHSMYCSG